MIAKVFSCLPAFLILFLAVPPAHSQERADRDARLAEFLKRFPAADANQDGTLTMDEFKAHQQAQFNSPEMQERLAETLKRFPQADTDKDGTLSLDEARAFQAKRREAAEQREKEGPRNPPPVADVAYGDHEKQRFDLWPVPGATEPTPLVVFIHGGGFRGGDKDAVNSNTVKTFHEAGIAYASMNYRLSDVGPYPIMMHDAARAFLGLERRADEMDSAPYRESG
ncbi:MAG: EF-hand domain-containing protein [Verrucomicrobiae bacterium]|nr:EF-hand domain-containing protein [Verrucomicrobiae bacterium]